MNPRKSQSGYKHRRSSQKLTSKCKGEYERIRHLREDDARDTNEPKIFKKSDKMDWIDLRYNQLVKTCCLKSLKMTRAYTYRNRLKYDGEYRQMFEITTDGGQDCVFR